MGLKQGPRVGGVEGIESENIRCVTVDDLVSEGKTPPCDVIKIDVEGAEHEVLLGAKSLLKDNPPGVIFFECIDEHLSRFGSTTKQLTDYLIGFGYGLEYARRGKWRSFDMESYLKDGSPPDFIATHAAV